ncbi:MAG: 4Fe-4S dicluster domain-containing protein [Deltaproteobacteria bacterium]|nr:4Fe-4S dicluster domain-containing protein [Deltaproteobacteria bacterium]
MSRQISMVFDLNKCIGCQTCSVACKVLWHRDEPGADEQWWCSVNTLPGRGTPRDWEKMGGGYDEHGKVVLGQHPTPEEFGSRSGSKYNWKEVHTSADHIRLQPKDGETDWAMNWDEDEGAGEFPNTYFYYMPRICNHCTQPACVEACPRRALYKRDDFGVVLRDEGQCEGNQACARACPYKKIYFNKVRGIGQHCIGCFPRLEKGVAPACVRQCPGRAVFVGYRDDPDSPVHKLVDEWGVALPHHPEFGTEPNVFYVPPLSPFRVAPDGRIEEGQRRIPLDFLESQFGPAVGEAIDILETEIARKKNGEPSEIMDTLIGYHWEEFLGPFNADPAEIDWRTE